MRRPCSSREPRRLGRVQSSPSREIMAPIFRRRLIRHRHEFSGSSYEKLVIAGTAVLLLTGAAFADFFVVQDTSTRRCSIVEERPTDKGTVVVGKTKVYKTRDEAEA